MNARIKTLLAIGFAGIIICGAIALLPYFSINHSYHSLERGPDLTTVGINDERFFTYSFVPGTEVTSGSLKGASPRMVFPDRLAGISAFMVFFAAGALLVMAFVMISLDTAVLPLKSIIGKIKDPENMPIRGAKRRSPDEDEPAGAAHRIPVPDLPQQVTVECHVQESVERYRALVETLKDWVWEVDRNGVYTYSSPRVREILGYSEDEIIGRTCFDLMLPSEAERVQPIFSDIIRENKPITTLQNACLHKEGHRVVLETSGLPFFDSKGNLLGYRGIDRDITERIQREELFKGAVNQAEQALELYRSLYENAPVGFAFVDADFRYLHLNSTLAQFNGVPRDAHIGRTVEEIIPEIWPTVEPLYRGVLTSGKPLSNVEVKGAHQSDAGVTKYWLATYYPVQLSPDSLLGIGIFIVDITERRMMEDRLRDSIEEKEVLLSEIHHRVKNNLTAFISLLSLDGTYEESPAGKTLRRDLQNRARSMALIHETLYRTKMYSKVDMGLYLTTLIDQVAATYNPQKQISIAVDAEGVMLDIARATPCGLIINELVTNSFKYAFPELNFDAPEQHEAHAIHVSIASDNDAYTLVVKDNGVGCPAGFDIHTTQTLGLKLVHFLARHQLRASVDMKTDRGTTFTIRFENVVKIGA